MSRWIRMQTAIFEHELFQAEPLTEREAWLWLIAHAAWKDTKHRVGIDLHDVQAGCLFVTLRQLQKEWRWKSDYRVRSFLKVLEKHEMITSKSNAGKTHVTICNYSHYQEVERNDNAEKTQTKRTKDTNTPINTSSLRSEVKAQAPAKASVQSELMKVLDQDHAKAVIEHRKALKRPLTPHAAKLLADQFAKCPDPNTAADAMIENCWQGFKPEWLQNRQHAPRRDSQPANRKLSHTEIWADALREEGIFPNEPDSHSSNILDEGYRNRHQESNVHPLRIANARSY
ncbi:hypothetical protein P8H26_12710 [Pseudochrobactrum sp. sp1633]|uniref:hypothetical protein n=1 Tax=Pseudochrobactrum sp. sp1633 TaxID=3036706 RepID=UPI0025A6764D|nr:hypothetical protein [Pseudochrobactrum sp. sp1633]MDM8346252.1 hypothetical protein [Pseudochrobactrum sp. sp1633]